MGATKSRFFSDEERSDGSDDGDWQTYQVRIFDELKDRVRSLDVPGSSWRQLLVLLAPRLTALRCRDFGSLQVTFWLHYASLRD